MKWMEGKTIVQTSVQITDNIPSPTISVELIWRNDPNPINNECQYDMEGFWQCVGKMILKCK